MGNTSTEFAVGSVISEQSTQLLTPIRSAEPPLSFDEILKNLSEGELKLLLDLLGAAQNSPNVVSAFLQAIQAERAPGQVSHDSIHSTVEYYLAEIQRYTVSKEAVHQSINELRTIFVTNYERNCAATWFCDFLGRVVPEDAGLARAFTAAYKDLTAAFEWMHKLEQHLDTVFHSGGHATLADHERSNAGPTDAQMLEALVAFTLEPEVKYRLEKGGGDTNNSIADVAPIIFSPQVMYYGGYRIVRTDLSAPIKELLKKLAEKHSAQPTRRIFNEIADN